MMKGLVRDGVRGGVVGEVWGGELWGVIPSVVVRLALINQCKCSESFILLVSFHS